MTKLGHWTTRIVALTIGIAAVTSGARAEALEDSEAACTIRCWDEPWGCVYGEHLTLNAGETTPDAGGDSGHLCINGTCTQFHKCAAVDTEPAVFAAMEENDVAQLVALMRDNPSAIFLNNQRNAIQVLGCGGKVLGHFPASGEFISSVLQATHAQQ